MPINDDDSINFEDNDYIYEDTNEQSEVDSMRETGTVFEVFFRGIFFANLYNKLFQKWKINGRGDFTGNWHLPQSLQVFSAFEK